MNSQNGVKGGIVIVQGQIGKLENFTLPSQ